MLLYFTLLYLLLITKVSLLNNDALHIPHICIFLFYKN